MCGIIASAVTAGVGVTLLVAVSVISFMVIPNVINDMVVDSTALHADTQQWERFEETPFPLKLSMHFFNITNRDQVLEGAVPVVQELGPFVYRLYTKRVITNMTADKVKYRRRDFLEFDVEASFPLTEEDEVVIVNVPYQAILQSAEIRVPALMAALHLATAEVFGAERNSPIAAFKVKELALEGFKMCQRPGLMGGIACSQIKSMSEESRNMETMDDGTLVFSILKYRHEVLSSEFEVDRGTDDVHHLGHILNFEGEPELKNWPEAAGGPVPNERGTGLCNMINGTDSYIYSPFVDKTEKLFALNPDICRSVELRFQKESSFAGVSSYRFTVDDWFLANDDGCFCLNQTKGITRPNGCLLRGAAELMSCVGGPLVLSYPHFLFAADEYRNGVIGLTPDEGKHKIAMEIEPYTGTPLRGYKRAQFNVFLRPIAGIPATDKLKTTLTPAFWIQESMELTEEFIQELNDRLVSNLRLVDIIVPVLFTVSAVVLVVGLGLGSAVWYRNNRTKKEESDPVASTSKAEPTKTA